MATSDVREAIFVTLGGFPLPDEFINVFRVELDTSSTIVHYEYWTPDNPTEIAIKEGWEVAEDGLSVNFTRLNDNVVNAPFPVGRHMPTKRSWNSAVRPVIGSDGETLIGYKFRLEYEVIEPDVVGEFNELTRMRIGNVKFYHITGDVNLLYDVHNWIAANVHELAGMFCVMTTTDQGGNDGEFLNIVSAAVKNNLYSGVGEWDTRISKIATYFTNNGATDVSHISAATTDRELLIGILRDHPNTPDHLRNDLPALERAWWNYI